MNDSLFCKTCSRQFQRTHAYESHIACCPKLFSPHEHSDMPSQAQLYSMVIELYKKCNKLQNEVRSLKGCELKEKRKLNSIEWLNENRAVMECTWEQLIRSIEMKIDQTCVDKLRSNSLFETMIQLFSDTLPCAIFSHNRNLFYTYDENGGWKEYSSNKFRELYNVIHKRIHEEITIWSNEQGERLYNDDHLSRVYNGLVEKIIGGSSDDGLEKIYKKMDIELRNKYTISV